jgi:hypothetical protein
MSASAEPQTPVTGKEEQQAPAADSDKQQAHILTFDVVLHIRKVMKVWHITKMILF